MTSAHTSTHTSEDGFTLMEVLAALVILSVAILGLIQATTNATRTVTTVETRTLASIVAANRIAAIRAREDDSQRYSDSGSTTQMGQEFDWTVQVEGTQLESLREITATVSQGDRVLVSRRSYMATPPTPVRADTF